jgi:hypothetical protein
MTRQELQRLRAWADGKISAGQEPQWAWYQLMKLREALDAIVAQMEVESVVLEMEGQPPSEPCAAHGPRLVVINSASEPIQAKSSPRKNELERLASLKLARSR